MRIAKLAAALLVSLSIAPLAHAASIQCTTADKSAWLAPAKVKVMLEQHGFTNVGAPETRRRQLLRRAGDRQYRRKKTLYLDPTDGALMAME